MSQLPVAQVRMMQAQGMDNNHIIQALQRDGYTAKEVFEALNQASLQPTGTTRPKKPTEHEQTKQGETMNQPTSYPPPPQHSTTTSSTTATSTPSPNSSVSTEELIEAIIDEKWNELVKDISMIIEWKNQAQATIASIEQQFTDLKDQFDKLHQALIAKIGEYDKNILDVGSEVKAMEKVFSKVLPVFTENITELSRITKELREATVPEPPR